MLCSSTLRPLDTLIGKLLLVTILGNYQRRAEVSLGAYIGIILYIVLIYQAIPRSLWYLIYLGSTVLSATTGITHWRRCRRERERGMATKLTITWHVFSLIVSFVDASVTRALTAARATRKNVVGVVMVTDVSSKVGRGKP